MMNEMLKGLAEASGWNIPEDQVGEVASIYKATMDDTRPVRELELGSSVPAILYKAAE